MNNPNKRSWTVEELRELHEKYIEDDYVRNEVCKVTPFINWLSSTPEPTKEECMCACHNTKTGFYTSDKTMCCGCGLKPKSPPTEVPEKECKHETSNTQTTLPEEIAELSNFDDLFIDGGRYKLTKSGVDKFRNLIRIVNKLSRGKQ